LPMCRDRSPCCRERPAAGFTLLEVIVALAIAGLAFAALFRAGGTGLFAVDTAGSLEEAVARAQSHLAAVGRDAALLQGDSNGDDGGGYHWWLHVRPLAERLAQQQGQGGRSVTTLYEVEVRISWASAGRQRSVTLRSERIDTATAPAS
jgi:general secretion pathway protein I